MAWFRDADLGPDETLLFRRVANLRRGWRSIGGEICVTEQRVIFVPNRLEALTRVQSIDVARSDVWAATVLRPGTRSAVGLGRGRAEITTASDRLVLGLGEPEALVRLLAAP